MGVLWFCGAMLSADGDCMRWYEVLIVVNFNGLRAIQDCCKNGSRVYRPNSRSMSMKRDIVAV
jgi:hypothetical protein